MVLKRLFGRNPAEPEKAELPPASIPEGLRLYAVGDVHGRADLLARMRDLVSGDLAGRACSAATIFLGDYVDRGPQSREVVEMLSSGEWPTPVVALCGNHETALLDFVASVENWTTWRHYESLPTLRSYGIDVRPLMASDPDPAALREAHRHFVEAIPPHHIDFLRSLKACTSAGRYFFCHAGVRPGIPLEQQSPRDLQEIREPFLSSQEDFGRIVVHGHTPSEEPVVRQNRIGIDTGAYATGRLTTLVLEGAAQGWLTTGNSGRD